MAVFSGHACCAKAPEGGQDDQESTDNDQPTCEGRIDVIKSQGLCVGLSS
jgi:hypothetical protein